MSTTPQKVGESIALIAKTIGSGLADERGIVLVYVEDIDGEEIEFGFKDDLDPDPYASIVGFTAPESWDAFGISVTGRSLPAREPLRSTVLVCRDGREATVVNYADGRSQLIDEPGVGLMNYCLRRVLGLDTPPPDFDTSRYVASASLIACIVEAQQGVQMTWPKVELALQSLVGPLPSWSEIRNALLEGDRRDQPLCKSDAEWMDEGLVARWLVAHEASPEAALAQLSDWIAPSTTRRVRKLLRHFGVHA